MMPANFAPDTPLPVGARFTLDGSDTLEIQLNETCDRVVAGLKRIIPPQRLQAVLLGGGYGRGEGGVLETASGDQPYNDLEFYVFVAGNPWFNERRYRSALHELSEELTALAGVEVEFKIASRATLRSPCSMFYYDLVNGHRRLFGDDPFSSGCQQHRNPANMPPSEATRLMMNRCSGLLLAREKLRCRPFSAVDADFVFRNLAKAQLALGDALLTVFGQYHWSCRERHRRLMCLSSTADFFWMDPLRENHAAGVEFKLHPHRSTLSRETLRRALDELGALALNLWLWLESRRLQRRFETARDYGLSHVDKWPGTSSWRNWLTSLKVFGPAAVAQFRSRRHPRDRVLNALTLLLWANAEAFCDLTQVVRREVGAPCTEACLAVYLERWRQVS